MPRGRKPKPREVREVEGNPGRRPLPPPATGDDKPLGDPPTRFGPADLVDDFALRDYWAEAANDLPWLRQADRMLAEHICIARRQVEVASTAVPVLLARVSRPAAGGRPATPEDVQMLKACLRAINSGRADLLRMMAEAGALPSTRARFCSPADADDKPAHERFFKPTIVGKAS